MKAYFKNNFSLVSIIIPCRNEEKFIGKCLDSIISQDYPKERIEVFVVDGMSGDRTRKIVQNYGQKYPFIKILENQKKFTNFAFNIGIKEAKGEAIVLMGAHASYEKDYVSKCVKYLNKYNVDNIGGVVRAIPVKDTLIAKSIAVSLSSFFGVGGSYFRLGSKVAREVDTVFGGCYKREVFDKVGLFNENLRRSQDMEFNLRLKKSGGKILLAPDIISYYYPQASLKDFLQHNFNDGVWVTYPLKFKIKIFSWRHLIPLFLVSGVLGLFVLSFFFLAAKILFDLLLGSYLLLNLFFSLRISIKKGIEYLLVLPIAFVIRHFSYGLGSIFGLIKLAK
ncbi:hypothetical protein AMJ48_01165 [Parcubacteria bacterium DG_74_1]|nr:MAG: hypothetical protein AMJ48_01165 [Parcubacteria bacterium DG_74_1]